MSTAIDVPVTSDDPSFHVILSYFDGKYWEGGSYGGEVARILYASACKNHKVYKAQLLSYSREAGWKLLAQHQRDIPPGWAKRDHE